MPAIVGLMLGLVRVVDFLETTILAADPAKKPGAVGSA